MVIIECVKCWQTRKGGAVVVVLPKTIREKLDIKPNTQFLITYDEAFRKEFFVQKNPRPVHVKHIRMSGDMNNNKMERMNGEIRDREKVVRGLKKDDSPLIDGYQIFHNYIRPHQALDGKTPSEACGITIQGDDKWKTLIQRASL